MAEWAEFYGIEPWGFEIEDLRHARLLGHVARVAGVKGLSDDVFSLATKHAVDPADGKSFVEHAKRVMGGIRPKRPRPGK